MRTDNAGAVKALFDAFNDGDLDRAAATVTDAFELVPLTSLIRAKR